MQHFHDLWAVQYSLFSSPKQPNSATECWQGSGQAPDEERQCSRLAWPWVVAVCPGHYVDPVVVIVLLLLCRCDSSYVSILCGWNWQWVYSHFKKFNIWWRHCPDSHTRARTHTHTHTAYGLTGLARGGQQVTRCKEVFGKAVKLLVELASLQVWWLYLWIVCAEVVLFVNGTIHKWFNLPPDFIHYVGRSH